MGDEGKGLYVAEDVVPIYRGILNLATIITPNAFEVEILSQIKITSLQTLHSALLTLHSPPYSIPHIALSSILFPASLVASLDLPGPPESYTSLLPENPDESAGEGKEKVLVCFASSLNDGKMQTWAFKLPIIDGYYSGVGDLFSALTLGNFHPESTPTPAPKSTSSLPPFPKAVSKSLLSVQQILLKTHLHTLSISQAAKSRLRSNQSLTADEDDCLPSDPEIDTLTPTAFDDEDTPTAPTRLARRSRIRELRLVQERSMLMDVGEKEELGWSWGKVDWGKVLS